MKKIYLTIIVTLLLAPPLKQLKAQEWFPIGAKWYYDGASHGMGNPGAAYVLNECTKDTVVDNVTCRQISSTYSNIYGTNYPLSPIYIYHTNDSVMVYNNSSYHFILLYKFNVQAADTLTLDKYDQGEGYKFQVVVDSVTQLMLDGQSLKQVYTRPMNPLVDMNFYGSYVERIGGLGWLFAMGPYFNGFEDGPIRCYSEPSFQQNFTNFSCNFIFGGPPADVDAIVSDNKTLSIYPNPASTEIMIDLAYPTQNASTIHLNILNQLGQVVYSEDVWSGSVATKIDISQLPVGLYMACIKLQEGRMISAKFIKE